MSLKLTSNTGQPSLEGIGDICFVKDKIQVSIEPFCRAFVVRNGKTVTLLEGQEVKSSIIGTPLLGDVYTIEKGLDSVVVNVEEGEISKIKDIFVNQNLFNNTSIQNQKTTFTVGIILLFLLIISVFFGIRQKNLKNFEDLSLIKLNEAISSYELIISTNSNKKENRDIFIKIKTTALELKEQGYKNEKLDDLIENITEKEAEILGEIKTNTVEFLDLSLQISEFNGDEMVSSGEDIFIFDKQNKNIIKVGIKNKSAKTVSHPSETGDTQLIGSYEDKLFFMKDDGIYEQKTSGIVKQIEKTWDNALFYLYANNIYLIDITNNKILRFNGTQSGFSSSSDWLAPSVQVDLSKVKDVTIDGSIWLLSDTGKVTKFTLGNPQQVLLKGIVDPLVDPTAIYTNENLKYVYILEKNNGRVVVIEKNGDFKIQHVSDDIKSAKDLIVSEKEGKIILLTGQKLIQIELK